MSTSLKPLGDRVLVKRRQNKEEMKGGIIIPDSAQEQSQEAEVVALGTGAKDEQGNAQPFNVEIGNIVLISKYGGTEIEMGGDKFLVVREDDIIGVVS